MRGVPRLNKCVSCVNHSRVKDFWSGCVRCVEVLLYLDRVPGSCFLWSNNRSKFTVWVREIGRTQRSVTRTCYGSRQRSTRSTHNAPHAHVRVTHRWGSKRTPTQREGVQSCIPCDTTIPFCPYASFYAGQKAQYPLNSVSRGRP